MERAENEATKLHEERNKLWSKMFGVVEHSRNKNIMGEFYEGIVTDFLKKRLKNKKLKVVKGLIQNNDRESPQVDIIVYNGEVEEKYICRSMGIGVIESKNVKMILEVKGYIDKPTIINVKPQILKIKEFIPKEVITCIWAFDLATPISEEDVENSFGFVNNFVILKRKIPGRGDIYDFGGGLKNFIFLLDNL
ncbi:MAG: DUF6602 domain-containing protein [Candidatus Firestonebacteria bacterium]